LRRHHRRRWLIPGIHVPMFATPPAEQQHTADHQQSGAAES
jgi:hypothetical protein